MSKGAGHVPIEQHASYHYFWVQACEENYPRLLSYALRLARNAERAPGIVHDAVCKILSLAPNPANIRNTPLSYLMGAVHNAWVDRLKKEKRIKATSLDDPDNNEVQKIAAPERDISIELDNETYRRELNPRLARIRDPRKKRIYELYLKGYSCQEIADALNEDVRVIRSDLNVVRNGVHYHL